MSKPSRKGESFRRPISTRQPRQIILVVCEGEVTEPEYFKALRAKYKLSSVQVEVLASKSSDPINIVDYAIELRNQREKAAQKNNLTTPRYDQVWCVFDTENLAINPNFTKAVNKADNHNIDLAISNPAFEYWFLLHFTSTTKPFADCATLEEELRNYLPYYNKSRKDFPKFFEKLFLFTDTTIPRAHKLLTSHPDFNPRTQPFPNPSTTVHLLIDLLKSMKI